MSIQLADDARTRLEARAAEAGFDSVEAYAAAILRAAAGGALEDDQLEALVIARIDGPFGGSDPADFAAMREKLLSRLRTNETGESRSPR